MYHEYDEHVDRLRQRIAHVENQYDFYDEVYRELEKKSFLVTARNFISSLIRQRQMLVDNKRSRKNAMEMLKIIDRLKVNLDAASSKDLAMARFFIIHEEDIRALIPGRYPSKRFDTFCQLRDKAWEINNRQNALL